MRRLAANLLEIEWRSEVQGRPSRQDSEKCLQDSTIRAPTFQIFVVRIFQNFAKCVSKFSAIQSNFTDGGRSFTSGNSDTERYYRQLCRYFSQKMQNSKHSESSGVTTTWPNFQIDFENIQLHSLNFGSACTKTFL